MKKCRVSVLDRRNRKLILLRFSRSVQSKRNNQKTKMSETFNFRSFVESQVERLASPTNVLVDKFRQTVDIMKNPFGSTESASEENPSDSTDGEFSFEMISSDLSLNSISVNRRQSTFRRHVSESNRINEPTFHTNPAIDVDQLFKPKNWKKKEIFDRSRSLIRQSTDTTCTYPIRRTIRRLESIEIPGLNGVKSIRYINDDLGRLQPELYRKQIHQNDATHNAGIIHFKLFFNQTLQALLVQLVSIENLSPKDLSNKSTVNPFVKLYLLPDRRRKFQSKVYKFNKTIEIDENFQYPISYELLLKRTLVFSINDFSRSLKRNSIGTVQLEQFDAMPEITTNEIFFSRMIVPQIEVSFDDEKTRKFYFSFFSFVDNPNQSSSFSFIFYSLLNSRLTRHAILILIEETIENRTKRRTEYQSATFDVFLFYSTRKHQINRRLDKSTVLLPHREKKSDVNRFRNRKSLWV